jgi:hypothetical protein
MAEFKTQFSRGSHCLRRSALKNFTNETLMRNRLENLLRGQSMEVMPVEVNRIAL